MKTSKPDEKKPAQGGREPVVLMGFDALIFRRSGDCVSVSALGASYSERPRCCDVVDAAVAWVARQPRERIGADMSLDHPQETEGIQHILSFIHSMESSYWKTGDPASVVEVPGLGHWIFRPSEVGLG